MQTLVHHDIRAYYTSALGCLRFVEARRPTGRRFGSDADARWAGFRGDLTTADRLDLLLRDADAEWPSAFGARSVFGEPAVAEDDAFGPSWRGLAAVDAEEVWRTGLATSEPRDLDALLSSWAQAWGVALAPFDLGAVTTVDRFVIAGPSAVAAALRAFVGHRDLAWTEQVIFVATPPAHRQLAAFSTAVVNVTMALSSARKVVVGDTPYAHEREALDANGGGLEVKGGLGDYFETFLDGECHTFGLTREALRAWRPAEKGRGKKAAVAVAEDGDAPATKPRGRKRRAANDDGSIDLTKGE